MKSVSILITGVHGFVGNNLVNSLKHNFTIYGLDIVTPSKEGIQRTYSWDELDQIPPVDAIIHLAGKAHDTTNQSTAQLYFDINTGLTEQIFDYYIQSTAKKFIFFSSVKAVADTVDEGILTEEASPHPLTPYGQSKLKAEKYILGKKIPDEKSIIILRPCMIHGPGNKGNLNLLYKFIITGIPYPLGAFENKRSFVSIGNLVFIIQNLLERNIRSGIYQVADNEALSTKEVIELIAKSMNKRARIWNIKKRWILSLAKAGDRLHLPFNSERLKKLTENYIVSNRKLTIEIGTEIPYSSSEGLLDTLKSFSNKS